MSKETLKNKIDSDINTNGLQQITGEKLNNILNDVVDEMALGGGVVEEGNTHAVSGGEVYDYVNNMLTEVLNASLEIGGIDNTNGSNAVSTTRARTVDYLNGNKIILTSSNLYLFRVHYYNDMNVQISFENTGFVKEYDITYPSGATKYRVSISKNPNTTTIIEDDIYNSILNYGYEPYDLDIINKSKPMIEDYDNVKIDYNNSINELGGITNSTGDNSDNNIRIRTKNYIDVVQNLNYNIDDVTDGYILTNLFKYQDNVFKERVASPTLNFTPDATYNQIKLVWSKINNTEVITNEDLENFSFKLYNDSSDKLQAVSKKTDDIKILNDKVSVLENSSFNQWSGKKLVAIGDSITYGFIPRNAPGYPGQLDSYAKLVAQKLGMTFENFGISGSTLGQVSEFDTTTRSPMIYRYNLMPDDADLVIFMGGTNDLRNISILGTMSDRVGWTYYGALHLFFQGIQNKYIYNQLSNPKKILALTPPKLYPNSTHNGLTIEDYRNAVIEVANYYSIPVFDTWATNGINPSEFRTLQGTEPGYTDMYNPLMPDGVHFAQIANFIMADNVVGKVKTLK